MYGLRRELHKGLKSTECWPSTYGLAIFCMPLNLDILLLKLVFMECAVFPNASGDLDVCLLLSYTCAIAFAS